MAYPLPVFNLTCNLWRSPNAYPATPDASLALQFYLFSRYSGPEDQTAFAYKRPSLQGRFPMRSDVRPDDQLEIPAGTGRLYYVSWVDDAHRGFANEYRIAVLSQGPQVFPLA